MSKKLLSGLLTIFMVISYLSLATTTRIEAGSPFSDMPDNWSTAALENAIANGLFVGASGQIMPEEPLTRAQMATIIVRAFGATEEGDISSYTDVTTTDWFASSMAKAYKMGVLQGHADQMNPNSNITREQTFAVLARALNLQATSEYNKTFHDIELISDWAKGEVYAMINAGYIRGAHGYLNPLSTISRAEFAQVMDNVIQHYIVQAGEYMETAAGNIMVSVPGVILKDLTVKGDLIIGDGVGDGTVIVEGVTVTGRLVIRGGGTNSVIIRGSSSVPNVVAGRLDGVMAVRVQGDANVEVIQVNDGSADVIIEGPVGGVRVVADDVTVTATDAHIDSIHISGINSRVIVDSTGTVESMSVTGANSKIIVAGRVGKITTSGQNTRITGLGSLESADVQRGADGTSIETPRTIIRVSTGVFGVTAGGETAVAGGNTATNNNTGTGIVTPASGESSAVMVQAIVVSGDPVVGETLTATPAPSNATGTYQWQFSANGTDGWTSITGATSRTYVIAPEYALCYLRVRITGTGRYTGTQISPATAQIQESADARIIRVLGEIDSSPGGNGETPETPITWQIRVANAVDTLTIGNIEVDAGVAASLYSDATFSANSIATIPLEEGRSTVAYIKVTAQYASAKYYAVSIERAGGGAITTFSLPEQTGTAIIDAGARTVSITVASGTDLTNLIATFTLSPPGAWAHVGTDTQESGTTENDFSSPVTYRITAPDGTSKDWIVTVSVVTMSFTVLEGNSHSGVVIPPLSHATTYRLETPPLHGTLTFNADGTFFYSAHRQPTVGFVGTDSFSYSALGEVSYSEPVTVAITIVPVNDAPVAQAQSFTVRRGETHSGQLSASDVDGDALTFPLVTGPIHGTLILNGDGTFTYETHTSDPAEDDEFVFKAFDGHADSAPANVTITIVD